MTRCHIATIVDSDKTSITTNTVKNLMLGLFITSLSFYLLLLLPIPQTPQSKSKDGNENTTNITTNTTIKHVIIVISAEKRTVNFSGRYLR